MPGSSWKRTRRAGVKTRTEEARKSFAIEVVSPSPRQRHYANLSQRGVNSNNLITVDVLMKQPSRYAKFNFVPTIMLSNTMSLVPKLDEVQEFLSRNNIDIGFITETWLKDRVCDSIIDIPNYNIFRKDRISSEHGGVCVYVKDSIKYEVPDILHCCDQHEVLWIKLKPTRLPRGFTCIVIAVVYHPPGSDELSIINHLFQSISTAESSFPNCGLIIAGDFNRLKVGSLQRHFKLKQLVKSATRRQATLDLVLTNLHDYYSSAEILPPFGLSDHNTVQVRPTLRVSSRSSKKTITVRTTKTSNKLALGRYLYNIDWSIIDQFNTCEGKLELFYNLIHIGLELITPLKQIRINSADAPWMTNKLKNLIKKRQKAFMTNGVNSAVYRFYRNATNRERKACKSKYYKSNIQNLKGEKPGVWWKEIKRISGMQSRNKNVLNYTNIAEIENMNIDEKANAINTALLEPLQQYQLVDRRPTSILLENDPTLLQVTEERVLKMLLKLNPAKASGPDDVPCWFLKEYADIIANPICKILNASFLEQCLPKAWKLANVTPVPKKKQVQDIKKDLRPISLTSCISKIAEDIVVYDYVKPAVLKIIDANQYGGIPKSSTTLALIDIIHNWSKGTDGNGSTIRALMFDYRKAFDLIDHSILVNKLCSLEMPTSIINWIIDFLTNRYQRIKLADSCFSEWGPVPSGVPQGTKLGPWLFLTLINDLRVDDACVWKFVDDTTASETIAKTQLSKAQHLADNVAEWSRSNRMQLNSDKCKELRISFAKNQPDFSAIVVDGQALEVVQNAKLLGLTISNDLSWNAHIEHVTKKASKRLYFLVQLKRANVPPIDLILFYITCIRSVIDYAVPVFHHSLPNYLIIELERIQKRALSIIFPQLDYQSALDKSNLTSLAQHHDELCCNLFRDIISDPSHKLHNILPPRHNPKYQTRHQRTFNLPSIRTNRHKNTFIPYMSRFFN